ncbi:MAG: phenylalanine--tRNA ligase subunit beta [Chitinophagaceae bacterium]|nr:phenylalanine--tRNA ligase subunit beta [Chitinophagaceae bacterium]
MTISYKWLCDYLPVKPDPQQLSSILTSVGLEVESMQPYEQVKGGLNGLVIGEVLSTQKHPNADKLTLTKVNIGQGEPLSIVCGAPNVAAGQKVVVAPVGATIFPTKGEPLTMRVAKIRGEESQGMICAEDEIGLGESHAGIMVLDSNAKPGTPASTYFELYEDIIYEIGLTPNRMDAMSHWGVARDVCAYLSHHENKELTPLRPASPSLTSSAQPAPITVQIENEKACPRYSGISMQGIQVGPSPKWMQQRLQAIGLRPINNIVDVTNYVQHETGQPLHAFDAAAITGNKVIVKNLASNTPFITLDEVERKLHADDLMICNATEGMCIAGVFGGLKSGVKENTTRLFLESAFFEGISIRKTSFRHGLRTDAATRFEKGTDVSATVTVLERAVQLIQETAGGEISGSLIDLYPHPNSKKQVAVKWSFLTRLSGKNYTPTAVKKILIGLGFDWLEESAEHFVVAVPYHKTDISMPADIVEEIVRIDGLDNIAIPSHIQLTPSSGQNEWREQLREKTANQLAGMGYQEMMTNSITNATYYSSQDQQALVTMINSLSAELNCLRPSLLETALEVVAHNLNHRNLNLRLFEFGKIYSRTGDQAYQESDRLCVVLTGEKQETGWRQQAQAADFYTLKGAIDALIAGLGLTAKTSEITIEKFSACVEWTVGKQSIGYGGMVSTALLSKMGIKQPVLFAELNWVALTEQFQKRTVKIQEIPRFPAVQRDLALVVPRSLKWEAIAHTVQKIRIQTLQDIKLFDIFESDKLGKDKKSMAVNFTFQDKEKTLTDKEIEGWMNAILSTLEKELSVTIRK